MFSGGPGGQRFPVQPQTVICVWLSTWERCKTQNAAVNMKGAQKSNLKGSRVVNSRLYRQVMKSTNLPSSTDSWLMPQFL